ncbi:E3 ubiquitin-protein ligase MARCH7 isoform X1 [Solea senegalensis]|uniref:RING-type E3 ubiquitin transferase n=1 Tax=Solea senegalensis TaxID=28829 RepID=A0AAV6Q357_SOLSE|nr:E3 ubiquitin-protein ligase MARCH7 isoform X1 [Solea senegalensis]
MMDSSSRRLPFCLSSSRSSYTSTPSSSLGSSRLYSRETVLSNDRLPRVSSSYKTDLDQQNSRLLSSTRDYSSSSSRSASWKLPTSLASSSRSYDRSWNDSALSSRSKLSESDGRLGLSSSLLNTSDDGDSKRAKLLYSNRGLYSKTSSTSAAGSTYSSHGLSSGRGLVDKQNDTFDSSWSSSCLLSRSSSSSSSSKPLSSRREQETKYEPRLLSLGERRIGTAGVASSLYQTDRVTSTYAQGARPKETSYSSSSFSPTVRERSFNHHLSSSTSSAHRSTLARDLSSRATARLNTSSTLHSSQEQTRIPVSSSGGPSSYSSHPSWYTTSQARPEATLPPRPAPEGAESEGRRSTRRLLSRLFSRRSSQDSSSGSSSVRSVDDDCPSTGGESLDGDEGGRRTSVDSNAGGSETTLSSLRNRRADLTTIQENNTDEYRRASRLPSWREPGVGRSTSSSSGSSWLSSSLRGRCPPLLSRLRRHTRDQSARSASGVEEDASCPQHLPRRWDNVEHKAPQEDEEEDDDEDEEDEEEEEGAVGVDAFGARQPWRPEDETLPELEDGSLFPSRRRNSLFTSASMSPLSGVENLLDSQKEKPVSSRDQEKLRKIKERLLLEDSDEEEGDLCRICQMREEAASNPLIQPCRCTGSLQYVHQECIKRWLCSKIGSGSNMEAITTCELCKEKLRLNIDNFDIQELHRTHVQSEYDEFISSGLYLVVLLHFCEERFSDVLGAVDTAGVSACAHTHTIDVLVIQLSDGSDYINVCLHLPDEPFVLLCAIGLHRHTAVRLVITVNSFVCT